MEIKKLNRNYNAADARVMAHELHKTAPEHLQPLLFDNGDEITVTIKGFGLVYKAKIKDGEAEVYAADGLITHPTKVVGAVSGEISLETDDTQKKAS